MGGRAAPKRSSLGHPRSNLVQSWTSPHPGFRPEAIVLLGDIQARRSLHVELALILDKTEVWFIHGNHDTDTDEDHDNLWGSELAHRNLHDRPPAKQVRRRRFVRYQDVGGRAQKQLQVAPPERYLNGAGGQYRLSTAPRGAWRSGMRGGRSGRPLSPRPTPCAGPTNSLKRWASSWCPWSPHRDIDYVGEGLMSAAAPFRAFGVDMGSHLEWPRDPQGETGLGGVPQDLLDRAVQVLGAEAQTWLDEPQQLLDGRTPAASAVKGGSDEVRSMLDAIQYGSVL